MCKCISNLEKKMIGREVKKKKVIKASFISAALMFEPIAQMRTISQMELYFEGQKKPLIQNVIHGYCPLCGEKYPTE